ncbi:multiple epidermal growth factor-like domains protein 10 [Mytilus californianus]|uniref:multiple epidermal growth factor-like domains protein 10 n=1 Tax=Mytilus californianus TaxID=6549 RepID=UPI0022457F26|nr:multiple epidermal growth factor-like domains protein 10 [Mytilus californianus]
MFLQCIAIYIVLFCGIKTCRIPNHNDNGTSSCCGNHQEINGVCKVCPPGYIGSNGKCETPCPWGYYGIECQHICNCSYDKRCNNVVGCICDSLFPNCTTDIEERIFHTSNDTSNSTVSDIQQVNWIKILVITCTTVLCFSSLSMTSSLIYWHWFLGNS